MIKRSPSRNNRPRGINVKHTLQIILLLGVCFWLIYQVKHSRDKKKEFDENDAKVSVGTQTVYPTPKLGRKDLHPGKDEGNHEHSKHEDEGNEHESEEKDDKHGVRVGDEEEEDESKSDEIEDERGGGDDEIDESDQEQSAADTDRDEDVLDEEEEKEEESDEKENSSKEEEKDGSVENHNSHEAREQQYNGDDASSAVTHDTGTTSTETESLLENPGVNSEMNTKESRRNQNSSNFNIKEAELASGQSSNASLSNAVYSSHLHNVTTTFADSHSEAGTNLTIVIPGGSNNLTRISANTSFDLNKMVIFSESNQTQNGTVNTIVTGEVKNVPTEVLLQGGNRVSEENQLGSNSAVPVEIEKGDAAAGESSKLEGGELESTTKSVASNETDNNTEMTETNNTQNISHVKENTDSTKDGFKGDSSDSHILKSVADVRTDLDTFPDIRNEGDIGDATATD